MEKKEFNCFSEQLWQSKPSKGDSNQAEEFTHCVSSPRLLKHRVVKNIHWEKPPKGWMKLNTDGSAIGNSGPAGCGGVITYKGQEWPLDSGVFLTNRGCYQLHSGIVGP